MYYRQHSCIIIHVHVVYTCILQNGTLWDNYAYYIFIYSSYYQQYCDISCVLAFDAGSDKGGAGFDVVKSISLLWSLRVGIATGSETSQPTYYYLTSPRSYLYLWIMATFGLKRLWELSPCARAIVWCRNRCFDVVVGSQASPSGLNVGEWCFRYMGVPHSERSPAKKCPILPFLTTDDICDLWSQKWA